jgi:hypothetical protein
MRRFLALSLFLSLAVGCGPKPEPKAPAKAKAKAKPNAKAKAAQVPLRVMASDIGPATEGKLVELTGKKTDVRQRLFQGEMWLMVTVEDGNFETFKRVAVNQSRWGGYFRRNAKGRKIRIVGRVVKDNNEWVLVAEQVH